MKYITVDVDGNYKVYHTLTSLRNANFLTGDTEQARTPIGLMECLENPKGQVNVFASEILKQVIRGPVVYAVNNALVKKVTTALDLQKKVPDVVIMAIKAQDRSDAPIICDMTPVTAWANAMKVTS